MWQLYIVAKTTSSRPSELVEVEDKWAAFQLDSAVCTIGLAIEAASLERVNKGSDSEPNWSNKYTMQELLDPDFRLPSDESWGSEDDIATMEGVVYDEVS